MVQDAVQDPIGYATNFGYSGTYWDYILEISKSGVDLSQLADLTISEDEIAAILKEAGFVGYRFDGALHWICKTIEMVRQLSK